MRELWTRQAVSGAAPRDDIKVVDGLSEGGAKLVELDEAQRLRLKAEFPGVRVVPLVLYRPALAPRPAIETPPTVSRVVRKTATQIKVVSENGSPVANADVIAFTDFANKAGAEGKTDAKGIVSLDLGRATPAVERLYVYAQKELVECVVERGEDYARIHSQPRIHQTGLHGRAAVFLWGRAADRRAGCAGGRD